MSKSFARSALMCLVLCAALVLVPASAPDAARHRLRRRAAPRPLHGRVELAAAGAGAERRSAWRGGCERPLPQGRCRVATGAAGLLDANAGDARQHPVRRALARGEGERAGLPHLDPRARQRREVPHLRSAVQQRHVLLDRVHAAPGLRHGRRVSRAISGASATCRATSTSRSPTCGPAWRAASRCPRVSVVGRDKTIEPYVKGDTANPLYAPFTQMPATHPRGRAGGDARRSGDGAPRRRRAGLRAAPHASCAPSTCPRRARRSRRSRCPTARPTTRP